MTVLNIMLGKKRGGLEQAGLDYAEALAHAGIPAITITSPKAWIREPLHAHSLQQKVLPNMGAWDVFASGRLRRYAQSVGASAIICHGNRACAIALRALSGHIPVIPVAHNYRGRAFTKADAIFCITDDVKRHWSSNAMANDRLVLMPNMARIPTAITRPHYRTPPVIGSLGRLAPVKGYDMFIDALALLKERGVNFRAVLGGDGEDGTKLKAQAKQLGLQDLLSFTGWVDDKAQFFYGMDIFVLSSRSEPFGIVLIEAMAHQTPIVSFAVEGPREIVGDGEAVLVPPTDVNALANALQAVLANEVQARAMSDKARAKVEREYTIDAMARRLKDALPRIISGT